ncbi:uncharacterized protein PHACADRAFT_28862 [Phanerochaete carnosa HHB-10118-sp]|uniref:Cytochrome P450 n=1 Tax=Phanerochaete carnosa (strain HHB-10118-sp) TaxID=650164 RepID=K5WA75_PHACS|nr:uncharacterized protein PHACADRAFT_28862 [Phanerochaete carnosa HHB-10118-sp]EKM55859.1 hypothetical protein PHACADRAFT_28862 [Phanerochaete carnosa HHB-10118-sp]
MPYFQFKAAMREGKARPCFATSLLSALDNNEDKAGSEEVFISLTGTAYAAGTDTTVSVLNIFVLAITMFPETQLAAQDEIDRMLGRKRLSNMEDRESLPQITAIVHKVLQWHPAFPLALLHCTTADDEYNGYHIPAGAVVIGNTCHAT